MEDLLRVGVLTKTHGLRGEVMLFPTSDNLDRYKVLKECIIQSKRENIEVEVEYVKFFKQYVIVKFKGLNDINDVEKYIKSDLMVTRENAIKCEEGEYFICDLIGMSIITDDGQPLGILTNILETGANNVYEVTSETGKKYLLPVIDQCILSHDLEEKKIIVHILPGLLDI